MADQNQVEILKQGVEKWNNWRNENPCVKIQLEHSTFYKANLMKANLSGANLSGVYFVGANLSGADLSDSYLKKSDFTGANLRGANLSKAHLFKSICSDANLSEANLLEAFLLKANLSKTNLSNANLLNANLSCADLSTAELFGANLTGVNLQQAILVGTSIEKAILIDCKIYGVSAWGVKGTPQKPTSLIITPDDEPQITVDDLEVAQFVYLLIDNKKIRNAIDTITAKAVLVLGSFKKERKVVLDEIRERLHQMNFTSILFDFDKPSSKDITGTVETLARMSRFIIADLTEPSSIPHELASIIPHLRTTPVQLIKLEGAKGYSMIDDYIGSYKWLLGPYTYKDDASLLLELDNVIEPANQMAEAFRKSSY